MGGGGASGRVLGPRRGWRAMNATNGYVVAWSFWDAVTGCQLGQRHEDHKTDHSRHPGL